jgi:hypothetical protein
MLEGTVDRAAPGAPPGGQLQTAVTVASNVMWTAYRSTISGWQQRATPPAGSVRLRPPRCHDWPLAGVKAKQLSHCAATSQPTILCRRGDACGAGPHT